jgi:beta-xylosidase
MYYTADEHMCVATSTSPLGPFRQDVKAPIIADEKCIDANLFMDDTGRAYLFFVRFNDGLNIWGADLESDLLHIKPGTMHKAITVSQDWETVMGRVNEGPFILKHNGVYYMTYSANGYQSQSYGVGYATANNPFWTWTKYPDNPILQMPNGLVGVGHSAMFTDKEGKLRVVFHAHNSTTSVQPRHMYVGTVVFANSNGKEIMGIENTYITPVIGAPQSPLPKKTGVKSAEAPDQSRPPFPGDARRESILFELLRFQRLAGDPTHDNGTFNAINAERW